jgi:hypothetical protein
MVDIHGVKYALRRTPMSKGRVGGKLMILAHMFGAINGIRKNQLPDHVEIVSEYRLIESKQSNLSRSQREMVVYEFHSRYALITPNKTQNKTNR